MKPERLTELIKAPWNIKEDDVLALRHVVENYPFFTIARLLYLYSAWKFDRINYDKHSADIPALSVSPLQINYWLNSEPVVVVNSDSTNQLQVAAQDEQNRENNIQSTHTDAQNMGSIENSPMEREPVDERDVLEKHIAQDTQKAINEWELIVGKNPVAENTEKEFLNDELPSDKKNYEVGNKSNNDEKKNFLEWLKSCKKEPIIEKEPTKISSNDETKKINAPSDVKFTDKRKKQWELLDKIIENDPGPIKIKTAESPPIFYQSEKAARESLLESEEFVTETLANIYLAQGHYSKAIRVFEILSLKIPQKNTYFAEKIKEIKNKQKGKDL
jgi:hypothetical protein